MTILEFIILTLMIYLTVKLICYTVARVRLYFSVLALGSISGVSLVSLSPVAFILPFVTKRAAAYVSVRDKTYAIRIFNGRGMAYAAHIASARYATVFMKSGTVARARRVRDGFRTVAEGSRVYRAKTLLLPDMTEPGVTPLLVFVPEPRELTYVTKKRTSIRVAFVGDEVFGIRVFTKRTLVSFIDRDSRGFYEK